MRILSKGLIYLLALVLLAVPVLVFLPQQVSAGKCWVNSHTRNGKHVNGYWRTCSSGGSSSSSTSSSSGSSSGSSGATKTTTISAGQTKYGTSNLVNLYHGNSKVGTVDTSKLVYVEGYYRSDGTYVRPHYRTHPNNFLNDNFSTLNLSALLPLKKYPGYQADQNKDVAVIEKYLLYGLKNYTLTNDQLTKLSDYAVLLNKLQSNQITKEVAYQAGYSLYLELTNDELISNANVKFDISESMTYEDYLLQVIANSTYDSELTVMNVVVPVYAYYLREAANDPSKLDQAKQAGLQFYEMLGVYNSDDVKRQIEMDLLQRFPANDDRSISSPSSLLLESTYDTKVAESYIQVIGKVYNITFSSYEIISYQVDLTFLNVHPSTLFIETVIREGMALYQQHGLSESVAKTQTERDVILFLGSLINHRHL